MDRIWFHDRGVTWPRVVRLAAVWAAVAAVVVLLYTAEQPAAEPRATRAAADEPAVPMPATVPGPRAARPSAAPSAMASCSRWIDGARGGSAESARRLASADTTAGRLTVVDAMARSTVAWHRAASLLLSPQGTGPVDARCGASGCDEQAQRRQWLARLDSLARQAAAGSDPTLYALAFNTCNKDSLRQEGACQLINAGQWAQLDPGNAAPWLFKADEAARAHDGQGVIAALHRVARAERHDGGHGLLSQAVLANVKDDDAHLIASAELVTQAIGVDAATVIPRMSGLHAYCSPPAVSDANRRQLCHDVAETLLSKSRTLVDRLPGLGLARRMGWPQERLDAIVQEDRALTEALVGTWKDLDEVVSCEDLRGLIAARRQVAELGEIAAARHAAQATGKTTAQLAQDHGRRLALLADKLSARTAAASASR